MQHEDDEMKRLVGLSRHVRSDTAIKALADDMRRAADRMRARVRTVYDVSRYPLPEGLADMLEPDNEHRDAVGNYPDRPPWVGSA